MSLDLGFIPVGRPGHGGPGSVHTSTLLIEEAAKFSNVTVYVISNECVDHEKLPATDRVKYVILDDIDSFPHPLHNRMKSLSEISDRLSTHDLVHSYCSEYIPELSKVDTPTIVTLNSYRPVCPKEDLRFFNRKCSGPSSGKCFTCITTNSITRNQGFPEEFKSYYTSLYQIILSNSTMDAKRQITAYHSLSPHLKEDYASLGFPKSTIHTIPHFYDDKFYISEDKKEKIKDESQINVLYVGRLEEKKGVQVLIRSLPYLFKLGYNPNVQIIGSGFYEQKLHSIAKTLNVDENIKWKGHVEYESLPNIYAKSDVFVYPGLWDEPFGRVFLEAMASQLPVLSSDVGSSRYIIGESGRFFPPGEERKLAVEFDRLINNYDDHQSWVENELNKFNKNDIIKQFKKLYENTANVGANS